MNKELRILVTGGAGFIGSHLCDRLLAGGAGVTAVDDLSLGRPEHLATERQNPRFSSIRGNIFDPEMLEPVFAPRSQTSFGERRERYSATRFFLSSRAAGV
jgi:nucleoside-diphosphate-sugar epimerase